MKNTELRTAVLDALEKHAVSNTPLTLPTPPDDSHTKESDATTQTQIYTR